MIQLRSAALALLLLFPASLAAQAPSLAERAKALVGETWLAVHMFQSKIGFGMYKAEFAEFEGQTVLEYTQDMNIEVKMFGEESKGRDRMIVRHSLQGEGSVLQAEQLSIEDGTETRSTLFLRDGEWFIRQQVGDRSSERKVVEPKTSLAKDLALLDWLASRPAKGSRQTLWSLDLSGARLNDEGSLEYQKGKRELVNGVPAFVHTVRAKIDGVRAEARLLGPRAFLDAKVGGVLHVVAQDERLAKVMSGKSEDLTLRSSVTVATDMGEGPEALDEIVAIVAGLKDFVLPQSHRQWLVQAESKPAVLHLKRDHRREKADPLTAEMRRRWLKAEGGIEAEDPSIRALAAKLTKDTPNPVEKANRLQHWVYTNLEGSSAKNSQSARTILEQRAGDCSEHARLFVALARAAGLPSREVGGLLYVNYGEPIFGWHAWAEVHDGHQWVSVDPAWDQVYVDAGHIRFSCGEDDLAWVNICGSLKLEIQSFKRR